MLYIKKEHSFYSLDIVIFMFLVSYLSNRPFHHGPTGQRSPVDLVVVVARVGEIVLLHLVTDGVTG